jgi:formate dehydrogenase major subunit
MSEVSFTLDGERVEAEAGSTILEAATQNGVEIPNLCHDPRLKPYAACRICLVEVEGSRGLMPACATPVQEGMVVRTKTDDLIKLRQMALELLVSDHYGDCVAPCKLACPAGVDIQGYIGLIANGQYAEALKLIKESNPLPLVCGRVCPRFCEAKCRRNLVDEPLAINALKRFVANYDQNNGGPYAPELKPPTGRRVAIVGGGPAGLSAAYYLALEGHGVSIFEANPQLGGMLRYGIPEYRLPKTVLDKEIAAITSLCRQVHCGVSLGQDFTVESMKAEGYEAIFIALGTQASQKMKVEGEDSPGVLFGIAFLRDIALHKEVSTGQKVAVVGGGNTAIDAARTALRLGAGEVTIVYRRSRDEMPASDEEIEQAEQEGVRIHFLAAPVKLTAENGRVASVECTRMALGEPDSSGRRRPEPIDGSEFIMDVDTVIVAIGQTFDTSTLLKDGQIELDRRGYIITKDETMQTSLEGIFAGGDCVTGPATVVQAVAAGRRAALAIHQYLSGQPVTPIKKPFNCTKGELDEIDISDYEDVARIPRTKTPTLDPEGRKMNFSEIELGFTEEMAKGEAERCLACGCQGVFECKLRKLATEYEVDASRYAGRKRQLPIRKDDHLYITRDPAKCILCGRCVRICSEVQGVSALGFVERGFDTLIKPSLDMPLQETNCESCGQCISTCPTVALIPKIHLPKPGPWKTKAVPSVCPYCGVGCNIELNVIGDRIVKVTSPIESPVNNGNLCKKGAFGYCRSQDSKRLTTPLIKQNAHLVEANWEQAINMASGGLRRIRDRSGGGSLAVLLSPQSTNEVSYLAQKLARGVLGTNNISSLVSSLLKEGLAESFGTSASTCSYSDILKSDLIIVFGCDITEDYPVIALKIREAVGKGSKLVMINPRVTRMDSLAKITLKVNPKTSVALLKAMLNYIISYDLVDRDFVRLHTTGFEDFAREARQYSLEDIVDAPWINPSRIIDMIHLYIRAKRPVIIVDAEKIRPFELTLINDLALITGNVGRAGTGIIALRTPGNTQGLTDMGVSPRYLPGQQPIADATARQKFEAAWQRPLPLEEGRDAIGIIEGLEKGEILGILVVGIDGAGKIGNAIFEMPIFSVLIDTAFPETPPYADVILPGATFAETAGTFTNCERRIQRLHGATSPPSRREDWEIISLLATALGYPMDYPSVSSISAEIASLAPVFKAGMYGEQWPFLDNGRFRLKGGLARLRLAEPREFEAIEAIHSLL